MAQAAQGAEQPIQWQTVTKKVVLLGASAVGKTSIFNRLQKDDYIEDTVTTMAAYFRPKTVEFAEFNCKVKINLWDTAGQERFQSLTRQYTQSASGVILVYDITDAESLQEAKDWYNRLKEQNDPSQLVLALVGNKSDDIDRAEVRNKDAQEVGREMGAKIMMEVSAKTGNKVETMFHDIAKELIRMDGTMQRRTQSIMINNGSGIKEKKKSGCCSGGNKKDKK